MRNQEPVAPGHEPESHDDTEQAALAMLSVLAPVIEMDIRRGRRPDTQALLAEARAVLHLIRVATNKETADELPDSALPEATILLTRMLEAASMVEGGDFTPKEGGGDE